MLSNDHAHRRRVAAPCASFQFGQLIGHKLFPEQQYNDAHATCNANPTDQIFVRSASDPFSAIQPDATPAPVPDGAPTPFRRRRRRRSVKVEAHDLLGLSPAAAAAHSCTRVFGARDDPLFSLPRRRASKCRYSHDDAAEYDACANKENSTQQNADSSLLSSPTAKTWARWISKAKTCTSQAAGTVSFAPRVLTSRATSRRWRGGPASGKARHRAGLNVESRRRVPRKSREKQHLREGHAPPEQRRDPQNLDGRQQKVLPKPCRALPPYSSGRTGGRAFVVTRTNCTIIRVVVIHNDSVDAGAVDRQ